jgi:hypothetical protein
VKATFLSRLSVERAYTGEEGRAIWATTKPFYCVIEQDNQRIEIIIPAGFYTDFCSVPRAPFAYLLYGGIAEEAGVVHDALYSAWKKIEVFTILEGVRLEYEVTRSWADDVLSACLKTCNVPAYKRGPMWSGVRLAGWKFYKKDSLFKQPDESP